MREYSPGASINDDYAYGCDNCGKMDGRATLVWREGDLPGEDRRHFSICLGCLSDLYFEFAVDSDKAGESIVVKRAAISEAVRNLIYERDGHKCVKCGSDEYLTLDHVVPFSKGGKTTEENFQTLCMKCNLAKGTRT